MVTPDIPPAAPTITTPVQTSNTARPGPPQRQSCDRCHQKKLRCTRDKNNNGGVCDRCLSKRAQCVYSLGLPKGRPSLNRRMTEDPGAATVPATTTTVPGMSPAADVTQRVDKRASTSPPSKPAHDRTYSQPTHARTPNLAIPTSTTETAPPLVLPLDMNMWAKPWLDTSGSEGMHPEMDWSGMDFSYTNFEDMLVTTVGFEGDGNAADISDLFSPSTSPSSQDSVHFRSYPTGQSGLGNPPRQQNMESHMSIDTKNMMPDKNTGLAIAQLSELSAHLSSLRSSSHKLAQVADPMSSQMLNAPSPPLIDAAAFESVAAWLSHGHLNSKPPSRSTSSPNTLSDVFSASHRFIEIIRYLQVDAIVRHLVLACEAMLLEIYLAVLTALEQEAYWCDSPNVAPLGNVRLVLVVQLCAYLIEHQHQAVEKCLSPAGIQKHYMPNSVPFRVDPVNGDYLKNAKHQVQKKLSQIRQILGCT